MCLRCASFYIVGVARTWWPGTHTANDARDVGTYACHVRDDVVVPLAKKFLVTVVPCNAVGGKSIRGGASITNFYESRGTKI